MAKILIVDDEQITRDTVRDILEVNGYSVVEASGGRQAIGLFSREQPLAVLLDLRMPEMDGIETMQELKKIDADVPVIFVTGHAEIPVAVKTIRLGAYDFIVKPPKIDRLILTLERAIEKLELKREVKRLSSVVDTSLEWILGKSAAMRKVIAQILQVASSDFSVVIQGETGTGKSLVAKAVHDLSKRAGQPFIRVDMGTMPETLVESELFGYERGAFTGAEKKKRGFFEIAHGGTIFIDELENVPPYVQGKLLSVVEDKRMYALGGTTAIGADVRIIAATNRDIRQSVKERKLREDLFFRLGEFIITLPPLRERGEDIPFLAEKFLLEASTELNKQPMNLAEDALSLLMKYSWPGNVRELKNVIRRAVLLSDDNFVGSRHIKFLVEDGPEEKGATPLLLPLKELSAIAATDAERKAIRQALELTGGNKTKAAAILQIDYKTLLTKIKEYNIRHHGEHSMGMERSP